MRKQIEKLAIKGFKGATRPVTLEFSKEKIAVLIYGENGSGKSTIVDAIDFICNERIGSFEDKSGATNAHAPALGQGRTDVEIKLVYNGAEWLGKFATGNKPFVKGAGERPRAAILRRGQILQLVTAKPADRYKELGRFITVTNCETSEQTLRDALRNAKGEYDTSAQLLEEAKHTLSELWTAEGIPGTSYMNWAEDRTRTDITLLQQEIEITKNITQQLAILERHKTELDSAENEGTHLNNQIQEARKQFIDLQERTISGSSELIQILEDSREFFAKYRHCCINPLNSGYSSRPNRGGISWQRRNPIEFLTGLPTTVL